MRYALIALPLGLATPICAQNSPNVVIPTTIPEPGPVYRLSTALRMYAAGDERQDAVMMAAAVGLARTVDLREASGWTLSDGKASTIEPRRHGDDPPVPFLDFLRSQEAMTAAYQIAGEDEDLEEVLSRFTDKGDPASAANGMPLTTAATRSEGILPPGISHHWSVVLPGQVPAEIMVIHDGPGGFFWRVQDEQGNIVCLPQGGAVGVTCTFVPAENGFFKVVIDSFAEVDSPYQLLTN